MIGWTRTGRQDTAGSVLGYNQQSLTHTLGTSQASNFGDKTSKARRKQTDTWHASE